MKKNKEIRNEEEEHNICWEKIIVTEKEHERVGGILFSNRIQAIFAKRHEIKSNPR